MHGLGRIGCESALDDFGSGFGSFAHLKQLPVDYLKIDGEFVRHLPGSAQDRALIKAIIDVAHSLNKRKIAEHVGSDAAISVLREHGADFAQGYHLGKPLPLQAHDPPAPAKIAHCAHCGDAIGVCEPTIWLLKDGTGIDASIAARPAHLRPPGVSILHRGCSRAATSANPADT
jgi:predicted signal transduction protein with EAL and GGDEF domain